MLYIVQPGDTLTIISRRFGTTVAGIMDINPQITNPDVIYTGQIINIPTTAAPAPGRNRYVVQPGDTLTIISRRFSTTLNEVIRVNPQISNPDVIYPGQIINLP